eukprot:scaffold248197_cov20-Tisochrysis_lutea.AAC.1
MRAMGLSEMRVQNSHGCGRMRKWRAVGKTFCYGSCQVHLGSYLQESSRLIKAGHFVAEGQEQGEELDSNKGRGRTCGCEKGRGRPLRTNSKNTADRHMDLEGEVRLCFEVPILDAKPLRAAQEFDTSELDQV